jgi:hypothetical protein
MRCSVIVQICALDQLLRASAAWPRGGLWVVGGEGSSSCFVRYLLSLPGPHFAHLESVLVFKL